MVDLSNGADSDMDPVQDEPSNRILNGQPKFIRMMNNDTLLAWTAVTTNGFWSHIVLCN